MLTQKITKRVLVVGLIFFSYFTCGLYGATETPVVAPTVKPNPSPTRFPTYAPTRQPTLIPTIKPTPAPTRCPTWCPTIKPTLHPTLTPSVIPSRDPTRTPTVVPSKTPTQVPSKSPTVKPSAVPTTLPTATPSKPPTKNPSTSPTGIPTAIPTANPTARPTRKPSAVPSVVPTAVPTAIPTSTPTAVPTVVPTVVPTAIPSSTPTAVPTVVPTVVPSGVPTVVPTAEPTAVPTAVPTACPTALPTAVPTRWPTSQPSALPTCSPTSRPSAVPTSSVPSKRPLAEPTNQPSSSPTSLPTLEPLERPSSQPSTEPTSYPTLYPIEAPSAQPSHCPTSNPSNQPSSQPTNCPTLEPIERPSNQPSMQPTSYPTLYPTEAPSSMPTAQPNSQPSFQPYAAPSTCPSRQPTNSPSMQPSTGPSGCPTSRPSSVPTSQPTAVPTTEPTDSPTSSPITAPSAQPTSSPTALPTSQPIIGPSSSPSSQPAATPSSQPSTTPSMQPSASPSSFPSRIPTMQPSTVPSRRPTIQPSLSPSTQPTSVPTEQPSVEPTSQPSVSPSSQPSETPSAAPTYIPSMQPSVSPSTQPSSTPSGQPTTLPTTFASTRIISCAADEIHCESNSFVNCSFFSPNVLLVCVNDSVTCSINAGTVTIGPNTNMTVLGSCDLSIVTTNKITVGVNSTVFSSAINFTSREDINIYGNLTTSGLGPEDGVGSPESNGLTGDDDQSSQYGYGGSYGGSGGAVVCNSTFFSNTAKQIGTIDVIGTSTSPFVRDSDGKGSGGSGTAVQGAGRGGGRIVLSSLTTIIVANISHLSSDGSSPTVDSSALGAGSGGSIVLQSSYIDLRGSLSARGGNVNKYQGGAGGGGRISIFLGQGSVIDRSLIKYGGGDVLHGNYSYGDDDDDNYRPVLSRRPTRAPSRLPSRSPEGHQSRQPSVASKMTSGKLANGVTSSWATLNFLFAKDADEFGKYISTGDNDNDNNTSINSTNDDYSSDDMDDAATDDKNSLDEGNIYACRRGGSGTMYIYYTRAMQLSYVGGGIFVENSQTKSFFAATVINEPPEDTHLLVGAFNAVIASHPAIRLPLYEDCLSAEYENNTLISNSECSAILLFNSTLVVLAKSAYANISIANVDELVDDGYLIAATDKMTTLYDDNTTVTLYLQANVLALYDSNIESQCSYSSLNISVHNLTMTDNSTITYSNVFSSYMRDHSYMHGTIEQLPINNSSYFYEQSEFIILDAGEVSVNNIIASNVKVLAGQVKLLPHGYIKPPTAFLRFCVAGLAVYDFTCQDTYHYNGVVMYNNSAILAARLSVELGAHSSVEAAAILICAPLVLMQENSSVNTDGRGCDANNGKGAGYASSLLEGGGGGGYGGDGGNGYNSQINYGVSYYVGGYMYSGSGGGCSTSSNSSCGYYNAQSGAGGGVINVVAAVNLTVHGKISSRGSDGGQNSGGGAGGAVIINAKIFDGTGYVLAAGGSGGTGYQPGGGGGGGFLQIFNAQEDYGSYDFTGVMYAPGGGAGAYDTLQAQQELPAYARYFPLSQKAHHLPRRALALGTSKNDDPSVEASGGSNGFLELPQCSAGHGNVEDASSNGEYIALCVECPFGYYNEANKTTPCKACSNKPEHSQYLYSGNTNKNCKYECDNGYQTKQCLNVFDNFVINVLTLNGLYALMAGVFLIIFGPLAYYRYKDKYDWGYNNNLKNIGFTHVSFLGAGVGTEYDGADMVKSNARGATTSMDAVNPIHDTKWGTAGDDTSAHFAKMGNPTAQLLKLKFITKKDVRRAYKMADNDMPFHACRINLLGSNHPSQRLGGPWKLPTSRPTCLRPVLLKDKWAEFAESINKKMSYDSWYLELLPIYIISFILPPFGAKLMRRKRINRADSLLKLLAAYDYSCFRCPHQARGRHSLRLGISPDATLAYLDVLYDEEHFLYSTRPLCPIGQARLPAAFRLAGLGTYNSPYFVDTNDLLVQAVPHTDVASAFIEEAWISYVLELNAMLRTIDIGTIHIDIKRLIKFLSRSQQDKRLGGLVVEFCTFANTHQEPKSEQLAREQAEEEFNKRSNQNDQEQSEGSSSSSNRRGSEAAMSLGQRKKKSRESNFGRDSFVAEARARRLSSKMTSTGSDRTWLSGLRDVFGGDHHHHHHHHGSNSKENGSAPVAADPRATKDESASDAKEDAFASSAISGQQSRSSTRLSGKFASSSSSSSSLAPIDLPPRSSVIEMGDRKSLSLPSRTSKVQSMSLSRAHAADSVDELGAPSSIDLIHRPSSTKEKTVETFNNFCSYCVYALWCLYRGLIGCASFIVNLFIGKRRNPFGTREQHFSSEDPHGLELSFNDMCDAIAEGQLSVGILVTHPKVMSNTYIVQDGDYESDDEAAYQHVDMGLLATSINGSSSNNNNLAALGGMDNFIDRHISTDGASVKLSMSRAGSFNAGSPDGATWDVTVPQRVRSLSIASSTYSAGSAVSNPSLAAAMILGNNLLAASSSTALSSSRPTSTRLQSDELVELQKQLKQRTFSEDSASVYHEEIYPEIVDFPATNAMTDSTADVLLSVQRAEQTYGNKTDKIAKFYEIMMRAESDLLNGKESVDVTTAVGTPLRTTATDASAIIVTRTAPTSASSSSSSSLGGVRDTNSALPKSSNGDQAESNRRSSAAQRRASSSMELALGDSISASLAAAHPLALSSTSPRRKSSLLAQSKTAEQQPSSSPSFRSPTSSSSNLKRGSSSKKLRRGSSVGGGNTAANAAAAVAIASSTSPLSSSASSGKSRGERSAANTAGVGEVVSTVGRGEPLEYTAFAPVRKTKSSVGPSRTISTKILGALRRRRRGGSGSRGGRSGDGDGGDSSGDSREGSVVDEEEFDGNDNSEDESEEEEEIDANNDSDRDDDDDDGEDYDNDDVVQNGDRKSRGSHNSRGSSDNDADGADPKEDNSEEEDEEDDHFDDPDNYAKRFSNHASTASVLAAAVTRGSTLEDSTGTVDRGREEIAENDFDDFENNANSGDIRLTAVSSYAATNGGGRATIGGDRQSDAVRPSQSLVERLSSLRSGRNKARAPAPTTNTTGNRSQSIEAVEMSSLSLSHNLSNDDNSVPSTRNSTSTDEFESRGSLSSSIFSQLKQIVPRAKAHKAKNSRSSKSSNASEQQSRLQSGSKGGKEGSNKKRKKKKRRAGAIGVQEAILNLQGLPLAPSGYQQIVNPWRIDVSSYGETSFWPVSYGRSLLVGGGGDLLSGGGGGVPTISKNTAATTTASGTTLLPLPPAGTVSTSVSGGARLMSAADYAPRTINRVNSSEAMRRQQLQLTNNRNESKDSGRNLREVNRSSADDAAAWNIQQNPLYGQESGLDTGFGGFGTDTDLNLDLELDLHHQQYYNGNHHHRSSLDDVFEGGSEDFFVHHRNNKKYSENWDFDEEVGSGDSMGGERFTLTTKPVLDMPMPETFSIVEKLTYKGSSSSRRRSSLRKSKTGKNAGTKNDAMTNQRSWLHRIFGWKATNVTAATAATAATATQSDVQVKAAAAADNLAVGAVVSKDRQLQEIQQQDIPKQSMLETFIHNLTRLNGFLLVNIEHGYVAKYVWYFFHRQIFGSNVAAIGPKNTWKILGGIFLFMCCVDITCWVIILLNMYCVSENATNCTDHTAFLFILFMWPFAIIAGPLSGIFAIMLGPSGWLARIYAMWVRLSLLNNAVLLYYFVIFFDLVAHFKPFGFYTVLVLTVNRVFQSMLSDLYIAHIENLRYTRGWDGLNTSLFKTKDNKVELAL